MRFGMLPRQKSTMRIYPWSEMDVCCWERTNVSCWLNTYIHCWDRALPCLNIVDSSCLDSKRLSSLSKRRLSCFSSRRLSRLKPSAKAMKTKRKRFSKYTTDVAKQKSARSMVSLKPIRDRAMTQNDAKRVDRNSQSWQSCGQQSIEEIVVVSGRKRNVHTKYMYIYIYI